MAFDLRPQADQLKRSLVENSARFRLISKKDPLLKKGSLLSLLACDSVLLSKFSLPVQNIAHP